MIVCGHGHQDVVEGLAIDHRGVGDTLDFSEPAASVTTLGALVEREHRELDLIEAKFSEGVVQHEPSHLPSVAFAESGRVEEADRVPGATLRERVQSSDAEESALRFHDPFDAVVAADVRDPGFGNGSAHGARLWVRGTEHAFNLRMATQLLAHRNIRRSRRAKYNALAYELGTEGHQGILPDRISGRTDRQLWRGIPARGAML